MYKEKQNFKISYWFEDKEHIATAIITVPIEAEEGIKIFYPKDKEKEFLLFNEASVIVNEHKKTLKQLGNHVITKIEIV